MGKVVNLIFPHQLLAESKVLDNGHEIYLIEEHLFFRQYKFHKQKLAFHRASMQHYKAFLESKGLTVHYLDTNNPLSDLRHFTTEIENKRISEIQVLDPVDDWLSKRLAKMARGIKLRIHDNPAFLNGQEEVANYFKPDKKKFYQTDFYKGQRRKHDILIDLEGNPIGGKWTFDTENRKKYPKSKTPPAIHFPEPSEAWEKAVSYVNKNFSDNPGLLNKTRIYPVSHEEAATWLKQFLEYRFHDFGAYEDAIVTGQSFLHHSLLSPLLNAGLLTPEQVTSETLAFAKATEIPLNSTEGFIRQIIGWREFIRGMYHVKGGFSRTRNFWGFKRQIPDSFYTGTTGIVPVDETIKRILETGYAHHIERLMVLGNFMLLCEFDPDEVYRWFMELFIDAYDWVMVPNVYGMSQFADGGTFATKPYIAGSNYLRKMSNYPAGTWQNTWDGLFWRFIIEHGDFFKSNPRLSMMYHTSQRMSPEKIKGHLQTANAFLEKL
jgi:deoxyribodipyrimidine photolyase-related protein